MRRAGSPIAGILLYRIRYWTKYAVLDRGDGRKWIAHTREWWGEECGLTTEQVKYAVSILRRAGTIETEQHFFGPRCITWLREVGHPGGDSTATPGGDSVPTQTSEIHPHGDTDKETTCDGPAGITSAPSVEEGISGGKMDVGDIAAKFEAATFKKTLVELDQQADEATTLAEYHQLWRDCMSYRHGKFVPKLGTKAKGQINNLNQALPLGVTGPFIFLVITKWESASDHLKDKDAWKKTPEHPNPGLVLHCIALLVQWVTTLSIVDSIASAEPTKEGKWEF